MGKSYVYLLFFLFSFNQISYSQIDLALKGGYTNSWPGYGDIELPDDAETDVHGFNIGILIGFPIKNNFGFSVSPAFIKKGAACFPGWQPIFEGDSKVLLNYLEFPISVNRKFQSPMLGIDFVLSAGYGIGYLSSASLHQERTFSSEVTTFVTNVDVGNDSPDSFHRIDHGLHLGARVDKNIIMNHFIFIEVAYYHGFRDYDKGNVSKNRNLNMNFGFAYKI